MEVVSLQTSCSTTTTQACLQPHGLPEVFLAENISSPSHHSLSGDALSLLLELYILIQSSSESSAMHRSPFMLSAFSVTWGITSYAFLQHCLSIAENYRELSAWGWGYTTDFLPASITAVAYKYPSEVLFNGSFQKYILVQTLNNLWKCLNNNWGSMISIVFGVWPTLPF